MAQSLRRIVTGLDAEGRSCIARDDAAATLIWENTASPADNAEAADRGGGAPGLALPPGAAQFTWYDIPPGTVAPLHATDTLDYVVIVSGEAVLVTETGETIVRTGDVVVQRGILHGWRNDGAVPYRVIGVMLPARPVGAGADLSRLPRG